MDPPTQIVENIPTKLHTRHREKNIPDTLYTQHKWGYNLRMRNFGLGTGHSGHTRRTTYFLRLAMH